MRESDVLLRQRRAAATSIRPAWSTISAANVGADQRAARGGRLRGPPVATGHLLEPGRLDERPGQGRPSGQRPRPAERPLQPVRRQRRRTRAAPAASTRRAPRRRSTTAIRRSPSSNTLVAVRRGPCSKPAPSSPTAICRRRRPIRSARPSASPASRRSARLSTVRPGGVNRLYQVVEQPVAPGRRARASGRASTSSTTTTASRFRARCAARYTFSSLANFLAGVYNNAGFTQTFGATDVSQTNPNLGIYVQDEWKMQPALTLNLGLRYDLQFLETINTDTQQRLAARRRRVVAVRRRAARSCAAAPACSTIAFRCAPSPTRCSRPATRPTSANLRQIGVSLSPDAGRRAGVSRTSCAAVVPSVTLPNLTTMDRDLQNAYSRQASVEVEQQLGDRDDRQRRLSVPARPAPADVDQPERADVRRRRARNNGCRPNPDYANNSQYSSAGRVELSRAARVVHRSGRRAGATTACRTRCRSR